jgi:hypothetical protein
MMRSERKALCVVMTGPDDTREEWTFDLDLSSAQPPTEMTAQLRERFTTSTASMIRR